jgi:ATP synthase protein I
MTTPTDRDWRDLVHRQARRIPRARRERRGLIGQSLYLGTLGIVFVLPVVAATYLGLWIDQQLPGYSVRGTLSGIVIGLVVGAIDVYLIVREDQ